MYVVDALISMLVYDDDVDKKIIYSNNVTNKLPHATSRCHEFVIRTDRHLFLLWNHMALFYSTTAKTSSTSSSKIGQLSLLHKSGEHFAAIADTFLEYRARMLLTPNLCPNTTTIPIQFTKQLLGLALFLRSPFYLRNQPTLRLIDDETHYQSS